MGRENEIPDFDEKMFRIKDEDLLNIQKWTVYFKNIHPRVRVQLSDDPNFSFEEFLRQATEYMNVHSKFLNQTGTIVLRDNHRVAMVVSFNRSLEKNGKEYLAEDSIVLCYGKKAWICGWGIGGLSVHHPKRGAVDQTLKYVPVIRSWGYTAKRFISSLGRFITENQIPPVSKKPTRL